jgi:hypothetical protein
VFYLELRLTDIQAQQFIKAVKILLKSPHVDTIYDKKSGYYESVTKTDHRIFERRFVMDYFFSESKKSFNFRDKETNHTLFRVNLNNGFHKNANNERIQGNRINIFSEQEYKDKADNKTHYKAYPLPLDDLKNTDNFLEMFYSLVEYTQTSGEFHVEFAQQGDLGLENL